MKVTACELSDDRKAFAEDWAGLARHVRRESSDLVVLPEMPFHTWWCAEPKFDLRVWREAVRDHDVWLGRLDELGAVAVIGSRPVNRRGKRLNEGFLWTKKRGLEAVHEKGYLPDEGGYWEASWYQRGDGRFVLFDASGPQVGMMICSDIWATQHARAYGKAGAHIIAVPHASPKGSMEIWRAAGQVVAIVSGAYSVGSGRRGKGAGIQFGETGWIIDPDGEILGLTSKERQFVTVKVNMRTAEKAKKTYPRYVLQPD